MLLSISTHALREEGDGRRLCAWGGVCKISTHALREEGDRGEQPGDDHKQISTHALREEGDLSSVGLLVDAP